MWIGIVTKWSRGQSFDKSEDFLLLLLLLLLYWFSLRERIPCVISTINIVVAGLIPRAAGGTTAFSFFLSSCFNLFIYFSSPYSSRRCYETLFQSLAAWHNSFSSLRELEKLITFWRPWAMAWSERSMRFVTSRARSMWSIQVEANGDMMQVGQFPCWQDYKRLSDRLLLVKL